MVEQATVKLNYRISGNGKPVVFIHGFIESLSMWEHLEFDDHFTKICFDLPGHGKSPYNLKCISSMRSMAKLIKIELDNLEIQEYAVVGHSMGGYVALELMKLDDRCEKLVLLNSNFWEDDAQKKRDRIRLAEIIPKNKMLFLYEAIPNLFLNPEKHHKEVRKLIEEARDMPAEVITETSISMSNRSDNSEFVRKNRNNILIIQGTNDALSKKDKMLEQNKFANVPLVVFEECGHMAHIECTGQTIRTIQKFLEKKTETVSFRYH